MLWQFKVTCQLVADIQAIEEALTPRLSITGEMATLNKFKQFFDGKSLEKGTNILLLWRTEGVLDVVAKTHPASQDYSQACMARLLTGMHGNTICFVEPTFAVQHISHVLYLACFPEFDRIASVHLQLCRQYYSACLSDSLCCR